MKDYIGIQEAVRIINNFYDCNIDPRGDLSYYNRIIRGLKLKSFFTKEDLVYAMGESTRSKLYKLLR